MKVRLSKLFDVIFNEINTFLNEEAQSISTYKVKEFVFEIVRNILSNIYQFRIDLMPVKFRDKSLLKLTVYILDGKTFNIIGYGRCDYVRLNNGWNIDKIKTSDIKVEVTKNYH